MEYILPDFHGRFVLNDLTVSGFSRFWEMAKSEVGIYAEEFRDDGNGSGKVLGMFCALMETELSKFQGWIQTVQPSDQERYEQQLYRATEDLRSWKEILAPKPATPPQERLEDFLGGNLKEIKESDLKVVIMRFKGQSVMDTARALWPGVTMTDDGLKKRVKVSLKRALPLLVQYGVVTREEISNAGIATRINT